MKFSFCVFTQDLCFSGCPGDLILSVYGGVCVYGYVHMNVGAPGGQRH